MPYSLHLTTFCLQYSPPVVACVCIHLACKWSNWEIPVSTDGKHWWEYVDPTVTLELLDGMCNKCSLRKKCLDNKRADLTLFFFPLPELTHEFLQILEKTPSRLKRIRNWKVQHKFSCSLLLKIPNSMWTLTYSFLLPGWRTDTKSQAKSPGGG